MTPEAILSQSFDTLELPHDAARWLLDVWRAIQVFDDVADGDPVERDDLNRTIWASFVGLQANPFHIQNGASLVPVLALQILKWQASDAVERAGSADARSYMWRAGYYDLVLMVALLAHGPDRATEMGPVIMKMYGDGFSDYSQEFA